MTPSRLTGLTNEEARDRLRQHGPNVIAAQPQLSEARRFARHFANPLIIILTLSAMAAFFLGDRVSAAIIIAIVVISGALEFINTAKSARAAAALNERVQITATVIREAKDFEIALPMIVVDDLVRLKAGDVVPADGKVITSEHLYANESTLTGESFPQPKASNDLVYMGSSAVSGNAVIAVTATGQRTKYSQIAAAVSLRATPTEFEREIKDFSTLIVKITFALVLFVFVITAVLKHGTIDAFLFSLALAVGLTPELLPMIIALNLTKGSLAMARRNVIVKRLSAIQNFGSMDILCTDKTGTLTEDKIVLVKHVDGLGRDSELVLFLAYLSSSFATAFNNPLDQAIKQYQKLQIKDYTKVDEIPFDFERKRDSIVVKHRQRHILITKGAPEEVLKICRHWEKPGRILGANKLRAIEAIYNQLSCDGFRVLAVATKTVSLQPDYSPDVETAMEFIGFMAFLDPAKGSVEQTLKQLGDHGVKVKILTGDNALVSQKIARDINLPVAGLLTGSEVAQLTDLELAKAAEGTTIFARVDPTQKMRIIESLRRNGHVVGYLGDGINDAPSLRHADVGISVNNAVDVAKQTADIILIHKSLEDLTEGIIEGRRTYTNTLKYLKMSLSSNFGNMFSMAAAAMFLPFLPMTAPQILFNNLLYDSSQFAIPLDNVDRGDISLPRKLSVPSIKKFMWVFGPLSSLFDFVTFVVLFAVFHFSGRQFQTGWFMESIATQTFVIFIIRTRLTPFKQSWPSPYLLGSTLAVVAGGWLIASGPLGSFFNFTPLPSAATLVIGLIVISYLVVIEYAKRLFFLKIAL